MKKKIDHSEIEIQAFINRFIVAFQQRFGTMPVVSYDLTTTKGRTNNLEDLYQIINRQFQKYDVFNGRRNLMDSGIKGNNAHMLVITFREVFVYIGLSHGYLRGDIAQQLAINRDKIYYYETKGRAQMEIPGSPMERMVKEALCEIEQFMKDPEMYEKSV